MLLHLQAAAHAVLDLGAWAYNLGGHRAQGLRNRSRVTVWPDTSDRPPSGARYLICLADRLVENEAVRVTTSDAVDTDVNWLGEQLPQLALPVRVAFEEGNRVEEFSLIGRQDGVALATANAESHRCEQCAEKRGGHISRTFNCRHLAHVWPRMINLATGITTHSAVLNDKKRADVLVMTQIADNPATAEQLGPLLTRRFKAYRADAKQSVLQLVTTGLPFLALLLLMAAASAERYWLTLLMAVPAAGLLVRLFIVQHDCGHGSFFRSRAANDRLGRALSVLTLTPYGSWAQGHAEHHASTGNLDRRGRGDVDTWTVAEYEAATPLKRLLYRLYRNPFVMVGFGAPINFIILQRLPSHANTDSRRSIIGLNVALIVVFGSACALFGWVRVLGTYLPVIVIAAWVGNWLFYVQHQFDAAQWDRDCEWNFHAASLSGSSYFKLPPLLRWFSGNIGVHHVHHLCSRVPNYHLQACVEAAPELETITKVITLRESLGCWRLALWDEHRRALVGFRDL